MGAGRRGRYARDCVQRVHAAYRQTDPDTVQSDLQGDLARSWWGTLSQIGLISSETRQREGAEHATYIPGRGESASCLPRGE